MGNKYRLWLEKGCSRLWFEFDDFDEMGKFLILALRHSKDTTAYIETLDSEVKDGREE